MKIIGIGDLHLDGKMSAHIPDFNDVVANEVRTVLKAGRRKGASVVLLYGDLCERTRFSQDALRVLLEILAENPDLTFVVQKGNHDSDGPEPGAADSLDELYHLYRLKLVKNLIVVRSEPETLFADTDTPIRILPWPHTDTQRGVLNVLHVEVAGASWETGRPVEHGISNKHFCVAGHIHTAQKVRNTYYSGTLYQTTFGEAPEKFYHLIDWTGNPLTSNVKLVPHSPKYTLENVIIKTQSDYVKIVKQIRSAPETTLWKVFVHSKDVILPDNAFAELPTVVKHSKYTTKAELQAQLHEEFDLEDQSTAVTSDTFTALHAWFKRNGIESELQERALKKLEQLTTRQSVEANDASAVDD